MPDQPADPPHEVGAGPPPHIARFATHHPDEFRDWIAARYTDYEQRVRPRARGSSFAGEYGALGGIQFVRTRYTAVTVDVDCPPLSHVSIGHWISGNALVRWAGGEVRAGARDTLLFPPYGLRGWFDCNQVASVSVTLDALLRVAEETTGLDRAQVRFTALPPVSAEAERQWLTTATYVQSGIYSRALDPPLLRTAAEQLVAASVLTTFPNTTMTTELRTPRDPATPATVRKALAFIDANADRPITLTDIADAAGVVPRTLHYAFRRHRDITPIGYLRQVRMARAHEELHGAEPGDGTTVAAVAARWGYARAHRFAAAYHRAYGQPPAKTLRS
ncbi:AraC-like DNA-binding protein [Krasilnikovia cinnamomea]|uniref:AraC-like DNA-binding protein n=1 Tax=Krasilnikovia cinnamomea TaxID=349313 RepID=A0A4Q7ZIM6_9ACTN|nr:AraC family transcriptional regulator [Krasilnikovia cinnamomea]RZU50710.1 AraC-like DNA-binding protein [Krasilnikovia cinnamomea]